MKEEPGHGLDDYLAKLNALPKEVRVDVLVNRPEDKADFDRKVRESIDRQHRRSLIANA